MDGYGYGLLNRGVYLPTFNRPILNCTNKSDFLNILIDIYKFLGGLVMLNGELGRDQCTVCCAFVTAA